MKLVVHITPETRILELHSWLRSAGYQMEYRADGSVHAVPVSPPHPKSSVVIPLRRPPTGPILGGAA